jgi:hypothetical protein
MLPQTHFVPVKGDANQGLFSFDIQSELATSALQESQTKP